MFDPISGHPEGGTIVTLFADQVSSADELKFRFGSIEVIGQDINLCIVNRKIILMVFMMS